MSKLYVDLETTGVETEDASIIEIAALLYKDGKRVTAFTARGFDPTAKVNLSALNVNKYTFTELLKLKSEEDMIKGFLDFILTMKEKPELCGITIHFDYRFIKYRAKKYNIDTEGVLPYRLNDIAQRARDYEQKGLFKVVRTPGLGNTLKDLCIALKVPYDEKQLHTAEGDTALYPLIDEALDNLIMGALTKKD